MARIETLLSIFSSSFSQLNMYGKNSIKIVKRIIDLHLHLIVM